LKKQVNALKVMSKQTPKTGGKSELSMSRQVELRYKKKLLTLNEKL